jgi:hypothetical protein
MKALFKSSLIVLSFISTLAATAQIPLLSSYPSASAVIFLDFDGHTVDGTSWNSNGPIYCGASGLNNAQVTEVFDRVAEDYRPFNVNITTDSTKYLAAPVNQRTRIIITVSSSWYGSAGGVSFVGSFTWGDDTPAFVFSALLNYNVKNISEAAAHEAGHTLGLYHQASYDANCVKTTDYNSGTGSGQIGWAPIMGVGYYENLTLWNNGPNSFGCTNYQSDLDIITTTNGFTYRADDYGATFATAVSTVFASNQFTLNGIIERNTDQDMIKFVIPATGRLQLNAVPYNVGSNNAGSDLDLQVTLYNSAQTPLGMYNPGTLLNSVIDSFLTPDTYYIKIEGKGNIYAPNYASLGSYSLQASFIPSTVLPLRRLELHGAIDGDKHEFNWIIDADEKITEQVLEISTDGRHFSPVVESPVNARSFIYKPYVTTAAQYRLNVTFDNGHQYYSNIVTLRQAGNTPRPQLVSNLIATNNIAVSSPGNYSYTIYDLNGKMMNKGQLTNGINNITSTTMPRGMYMISFAGVSEQWIDKFVQQ